MALSLTEKIKYIESLTKPNTSQKMRELHFYEALAFFNVDLTDVVKIIVTGTNGKGSTCNYLSSMIKENNYNVGLFTSPYYFSFNERIRVNNQNITDDELNILLDRIINYETTHNHPFSFFELITILSLIHFSLKKVQYIIMEVGIGGMYDCTNFINYDVGIITSISKDHTQVLGNTRKKIFLNKLGIFKPNTTLITFNNLFPRIIKRRSKLINAPFILINARKIKYDKNNGTGSYNNTYFKLKLNSFVQAKNVVLALSALKLLGLSTKEINKAIYNTDLTGRTEQVYNCIFDGAHNEEAIKQLILFVKNKCKDKKIRVYYSVLKDKELTKITKLLSRLSNDLHFVVFNDSRSYQQNELNLTSKIKIIELSNIDLDLSNKDILYVFTGSIHFIASVKNNLFKNL